MALIQMKDGSFYPLNNEQDSIDAVRKFAGDELGTTFKRYYGKHQRMKQLFLTSRMNITSFRIILENYRIDWINSRRRPKCWRVV